MLAALRSGAADRGELWQNAAAVAATLPPPTPGSMVTFAFGHDRAAFAAALLGTWLAGHGAALPENDRRDCVVPVLDRSESVAFLHDTGVGRGVDVPRLLSASRAVTEVPPMPPGEPGRIVLETHSHRGDGSVRVLRWTADELAALIDSLLERLPLAAGTVLVHGFTPTFLPAVLVGLLAPLRAGGSCLVDAPCTADELAHAVRESGSAIVLCSSGQLRSLAASPAGALQSVRHVAVDGALSDAADSLRARHDVTVEAVFDDEADPAETCAERLLAIAGVEDAAVAEVAADDVTLVAVVGSEAALARARAAAADVLPPGRGLVVRAVPALRRGPNGRIPYGDLCALFGRGRDGGVVTRELEWRELPAGADGGRRFGATIPERYAFFEGHFATYPVVAGGVQLHELVMPCVRACGLDHGELRQLDQIKFLGRISPGDVVEVGLRQGAGGRIEFEICCGDRRCTTGRLTFAARMKETGAQ